MINDEIPFSAQLEISLYPSTLCTLYATVCVHYSWMKSDDGKPSGTIFAQSVEKFLRIRVLFLAIVCVCVQAKVVPFKLSP